MKKMMMVCSLLLAGIGMMYANGYVTLQSGNVHTFYTDVAGAYAAAKNGDVIIIPGGSWTLPPIAKELRVIGSGYDPRYSQASGVSLITNQTVQIQRSNVSLEGLHCNNLIRIEPANAPGNTLSNIVISRCRFGDFERQGDVFSNILIKECVFSGVQASTNWNGMLVTNCFIGKSMTNFNNLVLTNNVMFYRNGNVTHQYNSTFKNNIMVFSGSVLGPSSGNIFINNIIEGNPNLSTYSISLDVNNKLGVSFKDVFTADQGKPEWTYDYNFVFALKPLGPAWNAGDDGTHCGVWGGQYPWKMSAVPMLPHIQEMQIEPVTNAGGKLNIRFKVEAQDH